MDENVQSNATSASSSLAYHHFIVNILGRTLILQRLLSSSCNSDEIITVMLIPISSLLRVSRSLLSFQKWGRSKHDYTRPRLRKAAVFGSSDGIEGFLSPKSALCNWYHAVVRLRHLILGDVISLLCRCSGGCEGGGGGMITALPYGRTVLKIISIYLLDLLFSYILYANSSDAH